MSAVPASLLQRTRRSVSVAWMLAIREWLADYRQSRLSVVWPLAHPLAYSALFVLLRPILGAASDQDVVSFGVFVFIGFCLWQTWFEVLRAQMDALRRHKGLMSRGELGAATLMLSTAFVALIQLLPRLVIAGLMAILVLDASPLALAGFVVFSLLTLFNGAAIGALLQPFATLSPDLGKAVQSISLGLLVTGAVFLPLGAGTPGIVRVLLAANPMGSLLNAARTPLFGEAMLNAGASAAWAAATLVAVLVLPSVGRRVLPVVVERMGS